MQNHSGFIIFVTNARRLPCIFGEFRLRVSYETCRRSWRGNIISC